MIGNTTKHGFTLIEVMVAIGIITMGSVGLLAMQQAAYRSNRSSRQMSIATNITQQWMERAQRDAQSWTEPGATALASTDYLVTIMALPDTTGWFVPVPTDTAFSYAADWDGNDTLTEADFRYCTHMQLSWFRPGRSIRVDVRTFYIREGLYDSQDAVAGDYLSDSDCASADASTVDLSAIPNISAVYASTIVKWMGR